MVFPQENRKEKENQRSREYYKTHKEARLKISKKYREDHKEIIEQKEKNEYREARMKRRATPEYKVRSQNWYYNNYMSTKKEVFAHYGNKCNCCGETNILFLTIDHINGRKEEKRQSLYLWRWLKKNNYPEGYQLLCYNCNCAKSDFKRKFCPVHHPELYEKEMLQDERRRRLEF